MEPGFSRCGRASGARLSVRTRWFRTQGGDADDPIRERITDFGGEGQTPRFSDWTVHEEQCHELLFAKDSEGRLHLYCRLREDTQVEACQLPHDIFELTCRSMRRDVHLGSQRPPSRQLHAGGDNRSFLSYRLRPLRQPCEGQGWFQTRQGAFHSLSRARVLPDALQSNRV